MRPSGSVVEALKARVTMFDFASLTILNQFNAHRMRENIGHRVFVHMEPHSLNFKNEVHLLPLQQSHCLMMYTTYPV